MGIRPNLPEKWTFALYYDLPWPCSIPYHITNVRRPTLFEKYQTDVGRAAGCYVYAFTRLPLLRYFFVTWRSMLEKYLNCVSQPPVSAIPTSRPLSLLSQTRQWTFSPLSRNSRLGKHCTSHTMNIETKPSLEMCAHVTHILAGYPRFLTARTKLCTRLTWATRSLE